MKHELTPKVISQIVDFAKKYEPKGDLVGIPREVISKMLQRQYEQNGKWDVEVFERCKYASIYEGGFSWYSTIECLSFWDKVIDPEPNLSTFFTRYPERFESEPQYRDSLGYPLEIGDDIYIEVLEQPEPLKQEEKPTKPVYVTPCGTFTEGEEVMSKQYGKRFFYKYDERLTQPYMLVGNLHNVSYLNGEKFALVQSTHISKIIPLPSIEEVANKAGITVEQLIEVVKQGK